MTKLCPRGKAAAKRKFKVYPSAYANAYASKICAGKIKDPSGVKRKDFKGPKPAKRGAMMTNKKKVPGHKFGVFSMLPKAMNDGMPLGILPMAFKALAKKDKKKMKEKMRNEYERGLKEGLAGSTIAEEKIKAGSTAQMVSGGGINYKKIAGMDSSKNYGGQVGGHSVMGSPVSVDVDGDTLSNPSASAYYKDLLK